MTKDKTVRIFFKPPGTTLGVWHTQCNHLIVSEWLWPQRARRFEVAVMRWLADLGELVTWVLDFLEMLSEP